MIELDDTESIETDQSEISTRPRRKQGLTRLMAAAGYSVAGLRAAFQGEAAIRMEVAAFLILAPLGLMLGATMVEKVLLVGCLVLVFIVELLNTGIEKVVDRWGQEYNDLAREAKDIGSAAVFISMGLVLFTWGMLVI